MSGAEPKKLDIRQINGRGVFRALYGHPGMTKKELMQQLHLSLPTVTRNIQYLTERGLAEPFGSAGGTGGRNAVTYRIRPDAYIAVGLDITRHHVTAVAVDLYGTIVSQRRVRLSFQRTEEYFRLLGSLTEETVAASGAAPEQVLGVGIGVPGLVTPDGDRVFYGKILDFTGARCGEFSRFIPYPTAFYNDANAAGYAEVWASPDLQNAFYLMLSNNVGGSVLIDGRVYQGDHVKSGEAGHMTLVPGGRLCYCGRCGCVDAYCAATVLSGPYDGNIRAFFEALDSGNRTAAENWQAYVDSLAQTVNNLRVLFDCSIILGGYVGGAMGAHVEDVRRAALDRSSFDSEADFIRECVYKVESIAAGAALQFVRRFLDTV